MEEFNIENCCADPANTIDNVLDGVKRKQAHDIFKGRSCYSEYHHLFPLLKKYDDKFKAYMRMNLRTFEYILSKVSDSLIKNWCNFHKQPIKPEEKLVVTIRLLVTGVSYTDLSFSFLMGRSTICYLIQDVLTVLWRILCPLHMPIPTADLFMDVAQDFYLMWDLPHCIGAIDFVLQATVDVHYRFMTIDIGGYGHQHDATTFRSSTLYKALKQKKIQLPQDDELCDFKEILPYFFIGDGAYPLNKNLIKPYPDYPGKKLGVKNYSTNDCLERE